jgi:hypothetical protein
MKIHIFMTGSVMLVHVCVCVCHTTSLKKMGKCFLRSPVGPQMHGRVAIYLLLVYLYKLTMSDIEYRHSALRASSSGLPINTILQLSSVV